MLDSLTFFDILGRALSLEPDVHTLVQQAPWRNTLVTLVVVLAGLSAALGQSLVLFASRIRRGRFWLSIAFSALIFTFSFFFLSFSVWQVSQYLFGAPVRFDTIMRAVGLGYAPLLFSFFTLAPYFGNPISVGLAVWSLVAINRGVQVVLELSFGEALLCTFLGWLAVQLLQRTIGRPLVGSVRWLKRRVAGAPLATSREELRELFDLPQHPKAQLGRKDAR